MRVLVTGGTGFVGRWASASLTQRGAEVFAVSRQPTTAIGDIKSVAADLLDPLEARRVIADVRPEIVLHCAWTLEPGLFWTAPENTAWISATLGLARSAFDAGVRRFVGVGTCYEYAWPEDGVCDEATTPVEPTTLYAIAKDTTRKELARLCADRKLSFAWARLFFLYGPFEHPSRLVPSLAINLARGLPAPLSSGNQVRDFMDVRDAGDALAALTVSGVEGEVNVASGRPVTLAEIADCLSRAAGRPDLIARGALPDRPNEPRRIIAATRRLVTEVNTAASRPPEQGLAQAYEWWQSRSESKA